MTDEQKRAHAMSQLRAAREIYSDTGDRVYLAVIDTHLRTIAEVDERRALAQERRAALLAELREKSLEQDALDEAQEREKLKMTLRKLEAEMRSGK